MTEHIGSKTKQKQSTYHPVAAKAKKWKLCSQSAVFQKTAKEEQKQ